MELEQLDTLDKQPTGEIPALKPVNLNTMIVAQVEELKGQIWALADIKGLRTLAIMGLVIACLNLAGIVFVISSLFILFGRGGA